MKFRRVLFRSNSKIRYKMPPPIPIPHHMIPPGFKAVFDLPCQGDSRPEVVHRPIGTTVVQRSPESQGLDLPGPRVTPAAPVVRPPGRATRAPCSARRPSHLVIRTDG